MKIKKIICSAIAVALLTAGMTARADEGKEKEAQLEAQAKVSKADAQKTALAKVPNGTVKEGEVEREDGKLIWSFDITTPDSKEITEVNVDANTGEVVNIEKETPKDEAKEKDNDKKEEKD